MQSKLVKVVIVSFMFMLIFVGCSNIKDDKAENYDTKIIGENEANNSITDERIDNLVSHTIMERNKEYKDGEFGAESHIILDKEIIEDKLIVYAIVSIGNFGFENGIFTKISGSGGTPTVITYIKDSEKYVMSEYKIPEDGEKYGESIKSLFPEKFHKNVLDTQMYYNELLSIQEEKAREYLKSIKREAEVNGKNIEKKLLEIDTNASNKLIMNPELNVYPYWIGSLERIEDGKRYVYEKKHEKDSYGNDRVIYSKIDEDGNKVQEIIYMIDGENIIKE